MAEELPRNNILCALINKMHDLQDIFKKNQKQSRKVGMESLLLKPEISCR